MSRFIAVFHYWFVDSKGFTVLEYDGDHQRADEQAAKYLRDTAGDFNRGDYTLVEIDDTEHLPRRLTWRERITGKLEQQ
ncbi:hypothetical protein [Pseudomonas mosselii]|uniref:hypothetical protein n=1 Tax=Pseudomonas mosselii TaxID=78327 RepID=UPI00202314A6|nr:hypothetical protein [Pseudomonas mosselii]MCL8299432.1 hypothetical protein [Pseudomonas mosselii]MCL8339710.1 hypothetical protein [Pseudomonas mosselii]